MVPKAPADVVTILYEKYVILLPVFMQGDGTLLATGSYDGQARIWSTNGKMLKHDMFLSICRHKCLWFFISFFFFLFLGGGGGWISRSVHFTYHV